MCAPLILAVTNMRPDALLNRIVYNSGRILTYGLMGAVVATAGLIVPLYRYQNVLSVVLGAVLLIIGLGGFKSLRIPWLTGVIQTLTARLKTLFGHQLAQRNRGTTFVLGALNGLLPCGLTWIALTWCLTLRGPADGLYFMLLFGTGTLPVMLGLTGILPMLVKKFQWRVQSVSATMLIVSGCALIARVFIVHMPHENTGNLIDIVLCK